jgi:hypothetical protein
MLRAPTRMLLRGVLQRRSLPLAAAIFSVALLASAPAGSKDPAPVATIEVTSATAGSSLSGRLVEGRMHFRDADYLLALRGLAQSANSIGSVWGLVRARDIEGHYQPSDQGFRNSAGVTIRFDPPLVLEKDRLEIEVTSRKTPKISDGSRGSGVE